ncbi:hypothetical protein HFO98_11375 [Rhizobium leguminosarum]|uniref:hypothetical protein n=1 Tax=Rhizobium leguminosarum TaxID=384 RepID=UPI001C98A845|nr:hypothetical protein [Rhizobium leguminosarum]MBY5409059.1 hypothetical protein [Rhizobium leguminosarum]
MLLVVGDMHCVTTAAVQLPAGFRPRLRCRPLRMYVGPLELAAYADSLLALTGRRRWRLSTGPWLRHWRADGIGERSFEHEGALSGSPSAGQQSELAFVMHTLAVKLDYEGAKTVGLLA